VNTGKHDDRHTAVCVIAEGMPPPARAVFSVAGAKRIKRVSKKVRMCAEGPGRWSPETKWRAHIYITRFAGNAMRPLRGVLQQPAIRQAER